MPKKIEQYLNKRGSFVQFGKRVTAISQGHMTIDVPISSHKLVDAQDTLDDWVDLGVDEDKITDERAGHNRNVSVPSIAVTVNGDETHHYSHVITTLPYPVLRTIDLNGADLNIMQKNALRALDYLAGTKIAILFKTNWWTTKLGIVGGQTVTDLPISTIIYPSHGADSQTPSKVLIASFSGLSDAVRLGSLATNQEVLLDLVLRNLAEVHSGVHPDVTYEYLKEQFVDMHVQDWVREEYALGEVNILLFTMMC